MILLDDFWTPARLDAMWGVVDAQHRGRTAIREAWDAVDDPIKIDVAQRLLDGKLPMHATTAFVVPVLSPEGCASILERAATYEYATNDTEEAPFQIPEAVLAEKDPEQHDILMSALKTALYPWWMLIHGRYPSQTTALQIASYNPRGVAGGNRHVDRDSSHTAVIALNTGFEGGGTMLLDGLFGEHYVPPVPVGHALIFNGRLVPHWGLPVVGDRKLLVHWAHQDRDNW